MRVAIIGGTGFVGGYLVDALLDAGHEPALLVRPGSEDKVRRRDACIGGRRQRGGCHRRDGEDCERPAAAP